MFQSTIIAVVVAVSSLTFTNFVGLLSPPYQQPRQLPQHKSSSSIGSGGGVHVLSPRSVKIKYGTLRGLLISLEGRPPPHLEGKMEAVEKLLDLKVLNSSNHHLSSFPSTENNSLKSGNGSRSSINGKWNETSSPSSLSNSEGVNHRKTIHNAILTTPSSIPTTTKRSDSASAGNVIQRNSYANYTTHHLGQRIPAPAKNETHHSSSSPRNVPTLQVPSSSLSSSPSLSPTSSSSTPPSSFVEVFLGVPYATPPIGRLRFMPPVTSQYWKGTRLFTRFASVCPQVLPDVESFLLSEDEDEGFVEEDDGNDEDEEYDDFSEDREMIKDEPDLEDDEADDNERRERKKEDKDTDTDEDKNESQEEKRQDRIGKEELSHSRVTRLVQVTRDSRAETKKAEVDEKNRKDGIGRRLDSGKSSSPIDIDKSIPSSSRELQKVSSRIKRFKESTTSSSFTTSEYNFSSSSSNYERDLPLLLPLKLIYSLTTFRTKERGSNLNSMQDGGRRRKRNSRSRRRTHEMEHDELLDDELLRSWKKLQLLPLQTTISSASSAFTSSSPSESLMLNVSSHLPSRDRLPRSEVETVMQMIMIEGILKNKVTSDGNRLQTDFANYKRSRRKGRRTPFLLPSLSSDQNKGYSNEDYSVNNVKSSLHHPLMTDEGKDKDNNNVHRHHPLGSHHERERRDTLRNQRPQKGLSPLSLSSTRTMKERRKRHIHSPSSSSDKLLRFKSRRHRKRYEYIMGLLPFLTNQSEDCLYLNIYSPYPSSALNGTGKLHCIALFALLDFCFSFFSHHVLKRGFFTCLVSLICVCSQLFRTVLNFANPSLPSFPILGRMENSCTILTRETDSHSPSTSLNYIE